MTLPPVPKIQRQLIDMHIKKRVGRKVTVNILHKHRKGKIDSNRVFLSNETIFMRKHKLRVTSFSKKNTTIRDICSAKRLKLRILT